MSFKHHAREITERRDPMQEFADRIVEQLEQGVKPWVRDWDPEKCAGPQAPFNPVTGSRYHGINVLILGMDMRAFQTGDPRWMTYQRSAGAYQGLQSAAGTRTNVNSQKSRIVG
jgi:antirestriction protein ArdC